MTRIRIALGSLPLFIAILACNAQSHATRNIRASGLISGAGCSPPTSCVVTFLSSNHGGASITISEPWSQPLNFYGYRDGKSFNALEVTPLSRGSLATSTTSNGTWMVGTGLSHIMVIGSAFTSETAVITIQSSTAPPNPSGNIEDGVSSVSGTAPAAVSPTSRALPGGVCSAEFQPCIDATTTGKGDMSQHIAACLRALFVLSTTAGVCDARGFAGSQTWSENPFSAAGAGNIDYPPTGTILICEVGTITVDMPIVYSTGWSITGCGTATGAAGYVASHFQASSSTFPATYSTGTVTVGTAGQGDIVTGSGTMFTSHMVGCAFVSPATQPTAANSTAGIIHAVTGATSIALGWGINNGTGAAPGSSYVIYCPLMVLGDGFISPSYPDEFGMGVSHLTLDCNAVAGCVDLMDWFGEENTTATDLYIEGYTNIGFDRETPFVQQSGPFDRLYFNPSSSCTAATISYESRSGFVGMKPFENASINNSSCSTKLSVAADIQSSFEMIENIHLENAVTGFSVGANTSCPVACPMRPAQVVNFHLSNVVAAASGTTVVALSNAIGPEKSDVIQDIGYSDYPHWRNVLTDAQNGCTDYSYTLGMYELGDKYGEIQNTTATELCPHK